jgi:hypothetical protein
VEKAKWSSGILSVSATAARGPPFSLEEQLQQTPLMKPQSILQHQKSRQENFSALR